MELGVLHWVHFIKFPQQQFLKKDYIKFTLTKPHNSFVQPFLWKKSNNSYDKLNSQDHNLNVMELGTVIFKEGFYFGTRGYYENDRHQFDHIFWG